MLDLLRRVIRPFPGIVIKAVPLPEPETVSGPGVRNQAGEICRRNGFNRVLLVTDQTLFSLGLQETIAASLKEQGIECFVFSDIASEPDLMILEKGRKALQSSQAEAILALGGGAVLDSCKMIAAGGRLRKIPSPMLLQKFLFVPKKTFPIMAVPTTAGTGAEITVGAVVTDKKGKKRASVLVGLDVRAVLLDGELMLKAPQSITCACGIDALSHGLEGVVASVRVSEEDRHKSMECVKLVLENLPILIAEPENTAARQKMCLAAHYGGNAINKQLAGYVHAFAHSIGAKYHLSHGKAIAFSLLPVMHFQKEPCLSKLAELSRYCALAEESEDDPIACDKLLNALGQLIDQCQFDRPEQLIPKADYALLARAICMDSINYSSPIVLKNQQIYSILDEINR